MQYIRAHNKTCQPFQWSYSNPKHRITAPQPTTLGNARFDALRARFLQFVNSDREFGIAFTRQYESEQIAPYRVDLFEGAGGEAYQTGSAWGRCDGGSSSYLYEQVLDHELVHHVPELDGKPMDPGTPANERRAVIQGDNAFNAAVGRRPRCNHN